MVCTQGSAPVANSSNNGILHWTRKWPAIEKEMQRPLTQTNAYVKLWIFILRINDRLI